MGRPWTGAQQGLRGTTWVGGRCDLSVHQQLWKQTPGLTPLPAEVSLGAHQGPGPAHYHLGLPRPSTHPVDSLGAQKREDALTLLECLAR